MNHQHSRGIVAFLAAAIAPFVAQKMELTGRAGIATRQAIFLIRSVAVASAEQLTTFELAELLP